MRVIVCGGRTFADQLTIEASLDAVRRKCGDFEVVAVGDGSPDLIASLWAVSRSLPYERHQPAWATYGEDAGQIVNQYALDLGADAVVAFPGGPNTGHMVRIAEQAGVPVWQPDPID